MTHTINGKTYREIPHDAFDFNAKTYDPGFMKPMTREVSRSLNQRRYTDDEKKAMAAMYIGGLSVKEIAKFHKTNQTSVWNFIGRAKKKGEL